MCRIFRWSFSLLVASLAIACTVEESFQLESVRTMTCCLEEGTFAPLASSLRASGYAEVQQQTFVNSFGTERVFQVTQIPYEKRDTAFVEDYFRYGDTVGLAYTREWTEFRVSSPELYLDFSVVIRPSVNFLPQGNRVGDLMIISANRASIPGVTTGIYFIGLLDWRSLTAHPYAGVQIEYYESLTMNGITHTDVQRNKFYGTVFRLYFSPGKGIVFFYDGASGETWALRE